MAAPFGLTTRSIDTECVLGRRAPGLLAGTRLDMGLGVEFWALLPAFVVVTLVGAIETIGDGVAIQRVSQRRPRATDFRVVQGALNADGVGNVLSGITGTLPNIHLLNQHLSCRGHRHRRPTSCRNRCHLCGGGVLAKIHGLVDSYPRSRCRRIPHCSHRDALCAGDEDHHPRRRRSPQGRRCRAGFLDRHGLPERVGSSRTCWAMDSWACCSVTA